MRIRTGFMWCVVENSENCRKHSNEQSSSVKGGGISLLTYLLTYILTYFTYLVAYLLSYLHTYLLTYLLTHSLTHSLTYSLHGVESFLSS